MGARELTPQLGEDRLTPLLLSLLSGSPPFRADVMNGGCNAHQKDNDCDTPKGDGNRGEAMVSNHESEHGYPDGGPDGNPRAQKPKAAHRLPWRTKDGGSRSYSTTLHRLPTLPHLLRCWDIYLADDVNQCGVSSLSVSETFVEAAT
jgi:hypothetical protein